MQTDGYIVHHVRYGNVHPVGSGDDGFFQSLEQADDLVQAQEDPSLWIIDPVKGQVTDEPMHDYLVFQARDLGPTQNYARPGADILWNEDIMAVRAVNPEEAVKAVMGVTKRLTKFAVVEATFISFDLSPNMPEGRRALLNP